MLIFLILVLVILSFVVLWNFDLHKTLFVKSVAQNAGDAAALMAARWQGISLNLVGDLNLAQAVALGYGDADMVGAVTSMQARLCFVGPMVALTACQQAAKNNGIYSHPGFTERLREHACMVREDYPLAVGTGGELLFPEPYPGCWDEYADMLDAVAGDGVAAGPDNARYYGDDTGGHMLLTVEFYEAIAGRTWCWFHHNAPGLLEDYRNFPPSWWPPLPAMPRMDYVNSEIFGLGLTTLSGTMSARVGTGALSAIAAARGMDGPGLLQGAEVAARWSAYDSGVWTAWEALSVSGPDPFPATGPVKPQYDYAGADAAVRIQAMAQRVTPGVGGTAVTNTITWTAAAKPFGSLNGDARPDSCGIVLPAFREVRLIPVDASSAPAAGGYDLEWREHIEEHLDDYMAHGPSSSSCWYCRQLLTWENVAFRREGVEWLAVNSHLCTETGGGAGGRGGGRRRGH